MQTKYKYIIPAAVVAIVGSAAVAWQIFAPRSLYAARVSDFATAQTQLGAAVKGDIDLAAATDRIAHVRRQIFTVVDQASSARPNVVIRAPREFLCRAIVAQQLVAFDQAYIVAIAKNMSAIAQPPPEKFEDLVKQLAERYQIRADKEIKERDEMQRCARLYDSDDKWIARYPQSTPGVENPGAAIAAAEALYKFTATMGQLVLTQVDDGRRARALKEFFSNQDNTKDLQKHIDGLRKVLATRLAINRAKAHQAYETAYAPLAQAMYALTATKVAACKDWQGAADKPANRDQYPADPRFRACFDAIWAGVEAPLEKALTAAIAYDPLMLARESEAFAALDKSIAKMQELANDKIDNVDELKAVVETAVKIFKTADQMQKVASSEETKAMTKNIKDLIESMK